MIELEHSNEVMERMNKEIKEVEEIYKGKTEEEKAIFDRENPYLADLFKDITKDENKNPKCIFCGGDTKVSIAKDSHGGHEVLICSKCHKFQNTVKKETE